MNVSAMLERVVRAVTFDIKFFKQAESDISLTQEALIVVVLSSVLAAIGSFGDKADSLVGWIGYAIVSIIWGVLGYYLWAWVTQLVGVNFFKGTADVGELQRTLGYAWAPRALGLFGFIWVLGPILGAVGVLWSLAVGVVAVREALNIDTSKALLTAAIGWVIVAIIGGVLGMIFGLGSFVAGIF